jgi:hypothetical protein
MSLSVSSLSAPAFLRRVLLADAATSAAAGLLMLLGAGLVADPLGLPAALLRGAGLALLPFAACVGFLGLRGGISRPAVRAVILLNALWVAASLVLLLGGWVAPTALGYAFVIAQAAAVALLAELQYVGLRRLAAAIA